MLISSSSDDMTAGELINTYTNSRMLLMNIGRSWNTNRKVGAKKVLLIVTNFSQDVRIFFTFKIDVGA